MNKKKKLLLNWWLNSGGGVVTPWYLGGGLIPVSTNYTIYDPLAATSLANSYINLANPGTRNATAPVAAPTHAQGTGWTFNGSTQYLSTGTNLKAASTIIIWVEGASGVYIIGAFQFTATRNFQIRPINGLNTRYGYGATQSDKAGQTLGSVLALKSTKAIKNAVDLGAVGTWVGADHTIPAFIGCENQAGSAVNFAGGRVLRVAIYDITLSDAQIEGVTWAMVNYNQPANDSYVNTVLSLNPICYYSCNQAIGSPLFDLSGHKAHGEVFGLTIGQAGLKGNSLAGTGSASNYTATIGNWSALTGINLNQFSFACWIKVTVTPSNQVRVCNIYSGALNEYFALELRNGQDIDIFSRETGVNQTINTNLDVVNNTWMHLVAGNDLANGKVFVYLNGVYYEFAKTVSGFTDTTPDTTYPLCAQDLDGNIQHLVWFDHKLSQSEVNTLYV